MGGARFPRTAGVKCFQGSCWGSLYYSTGLLWSAFPPPWIHCAVRNNNAHQRQCRKNLSFRGYTTQNLNILMSYEHYEWVRIKWKEWKSELPWINIIYKTIITIKQLSNMIKKTCSWKSAYFIYCSTIPSCTIFFLKVIHPDRNELTLQETLSCLDSTEETNDCRCASD